MAPGMTRPASHVVNQLNSHQNSIPLQMSFNRPCHMASNNKSMLNCVHDHMQLELWQRYRHRPLPHLQVKRPPAPACPAHPIASSPGHAQAVPRHPFVQQLQSAEQRLHAPSIFLTVPQSVHFSKTVNGARLNPPGAQLVYKDRKSSAHSNGGGAKLEESGRLGGLLCEYHSAQRRCCTFRNPARRAARATREGL